MFDIAQRENLSGCSVKELITRLQQLRANTVVCCCGMDTMYLHVEQDGSAICLDVDELEDSYPDSHTADADRKPSRKVYAGSLFEKAHALLARWENRIRERYADACRKIARSWNRDHPTYQEFVLAAHMRQAKEDVQFLQGELDAARKSNANLQRKFQALKETFAGVLEKSDGQLRQELHFDVREAENGPGWEVVTQHCYLGGCDMGVYTFPKERDALIFAALLSATEYKPSHNTACSVCYAEYIKGCI